jgi:hypothetical protein
MPRGRRIAALAVLAIATCVFWRTAYPTITWWDSPNYSLAAHSLGMTSPPGSLLLTLIGWPVSHLPLGMTPARMLNLFAGLLAGVTVALVFVVALRLRAPSGAAKGEASTAALGGAAIGALTFAFSATLWEHAIKFTPYILTTVFTGLILWTMLRWWDAAEQPSSRTWLFFLTLLFGLDFSVHRTNAMLIPGAIAWIAIRRPAALVAPRNVVAAIGGLCAGLAVQLLMIPISHYSPSTVHMFPTYTWGEFWSYVSLENSGGNFLLNLWPRKSGFWSVQFADFARTFGENFVQWKTSVSFLGVVPVIAGIGGFVALFRRSKSLAGAWTAAFVLLVMSTVVYFNIPAGFFRPFDRHYLPIFVMFGVTIAFGMASAIEYLFRLVRRPRSAQLAGGALIALVPVVQLTANWRAHDASRRYFAEDFARNSLESLPQNAIYFTVGDNDTYPMMYLQNAEGVRPDVQIMNEGLSTFDWFTNQVKRRDPTFPVSYTAEERFARGKKSRDTTLVIPVEGTTDTVRLGVKPLYGRTFYPADLAIMDIVTTNRWRRPITFASTTGARVKWLSPDARLEGMHWRVGPPGPSADDGSILRDNLMTKFEYRGFDDPAITIEPQSRGMGFQYILAFQELLRRERAAGRTGACRTALARYLQTFPPERMKFGDEIVSALRTSCGQPYNTRVPL